MEYENDDGAAAQWTFDGLALLDGGTMLAAAATQTDIDPSKCFVFGQDKKETLEMKHQEIQSDAIVTRSMDTKTAEFTSRNTAVQATPKSLPFQHHTPEAVQILGPFIDAPAIADLTQGVLNRMEEQLRKSKEIIDRKSEAATDLDMFKRELMRASIKYCLD
jgi:hypothetical protein